MSQSDPENQAIAENQPADRQDAPALEQSQSVEIVATAIYWQGSLPPPSMLQQYDDALPGAAERIMRIAEAEENQRIQAENRRIEQDDRRIAIEEQRVQQDDRRIAIEEQRVRQDDRRIDQDDRRIEMEKASAAVASKRGYLGLAGAFALALLLIAIGAHAVVWGNPWVGVAVIGANIAGIAGIFVYGTNARLRASERKAADSDNRRDDAPAP